MKSPHSNLDESVISGHENSDNGSSYLDQEIIKNYQLESRFSEHAKEIFDELIFPRMQTLQGLFTNASISVSRFAFECKVSIVAEWKHDTTFECELKITLDQENEKILIAWRFHELPSLREFNISEVLSTGLQHLDLAKIDAFVDDKIEHATLALLPNVTTW